LPVEVTLYIDGEGDQQKFTCWLVSEEDVGRAKSLVPIDPLSVLARICSRVASEVKGYSSADDLFCEMVDSAVRVAEINTLLTMGLNADDIVSQLSREIISEIKII